MMSKSETLRLVMRKWLIGKGYYAAVEAMSFAARLHTGMRKDGVTPEFDHQVQIARYVATLEPSLMHPESTLAVTFLHDAREDKDIADEEIRPRFGAQIADAVARVTKVFRGVRRSDDEVFAGIAVCPIASVVKGADRINNLQSMVGVFTMAKQREYLAESDRHFFPMIRTARDHFPRQEHAYENIKHVLRSQMALIRAIHDAQGGLT